MTTKSLLFFTIIFCTLLAPPPQGVRADGETALQDASFELQLAPDQGGWRLFDNSTFSSDEARSGDQSMFNWGFSRTVAYPPFFIGSASGSYQEFAAGPGSRWRLTGYGLAPIGLKGTPAFGIVQVSFFDAIGNDLGTVETADSNTPRAKTSNEVNSQTLVGEWTFLDTGIATAPEGTTTVQAFTLYVDYSGSNATQGVYFDDLSLCAVDEDADNQTACK
jgi:hypothetical protein